MQTRQSIIELFSTFVQFNADCFGGWATDARLRRSMLSCVNRALDAEENFWALYWCKVWQSENDVKMLLAKGHLTAYLQEPCYWTAQKVAAGFSSTQYTRSDCFQVAISHVDKVLIGFNPNQGYGLKNYASVIFASVIRETLRQRHEVDICTPWGLLRKISHKRLVESLQRAGLSSDVIKAYVQAWQCFKLLYVPSQASGTRKLNKPDAATLEAITSRYNSQAAVSVTPTTLERWLLTCAEAARSYLYPPVSLPGDDKLDILPPLDNSLLDEIIARDDEKIRNTQQGEINQLLVNTLHQLSSQAQELLELYYAQGATQQQIAQKLQMKQYTISRRLTKARESLLMALAKWSQEQLHIALSSDVLKNSSSLLEEWLQAHYSQPPVPTPPQ